MAQVKKSVPGMAFISYNLYITLLLACSNEVRLIKK